MPQGSKNDASAWDHLPTVYVMHEYLPQREMPRLYKLADCFVIASRWVAGLAGMRASGPGGLATCGTGC